MTRLALCLLLLATGAICRAVITKITDWTVQMPKDLMS